MTFDYSSNATSLSTGTYTAVTALSFTAPEAAATGIIDGNASVNQVSVSGAISGLAWAPGATIYLRWTDTDTTGSDDGLAIDSLSITTGNSVPVQAANLGLTVTGGTTTALTATELSYTDAEQVASAVTYTLSSIPATGTLSLSGTPLAIA
ncbi:MAG: cadherin-like domain-containing protein, partial [Pirellulaceae bacterium]|nr:cadherin-like domain-containing protein [Pirellulaceae bacterium]